MTGEEGVEEELLEDALEVALLELSGEEDGVEETGFEEASLSEAGRDVVSEETGVNELRMALGLVHALSSKKSEPKRRASGLESESFFIKNHPAAN